MLTVDVPCAGRQLDGAPSAISALPAVVSAVAGDAEVYMDGGVRRGADIVKALALGARACLAGRALGYGLAAAGEPGARRAVRILHEQLHTTLALAGCPSVQALDASWARPRGSPAGRAADQSAASADGATQNIPSSDAARPSANNGASAPSSPPSRARP